MKNEIKKVNKGKALEQILPDAWISKDLNHAKSFIDWVKSSLFYDLTYNDNDKMWYDMIWHDVLSFCIILQYFMLCNTVFLHDIIS